MKLFEDLPSTNKPITAENLNQIQDNLVVVSATEPTGDNREKVWMQTGKNLFNKNEAILNAGYFDNTGSLVTTETDWYQRTFIKVEPNTQYTISSAQGIFRICYYSETGNNKTFISRDATENKNFTFITPNNCKYIRISGTLLNNQIDSLQIEKGGIATEYEGYIEDTLYINNDGIYEEFMPDEEPKSVYSKVHEGTGISVGAWKKGNVIELGLYTLGIKSTIAAGQRNIVIGTLPEGCRPLSDKNYAVMTGYGKIFNLLVTPAGAIMIGYVYQELAAGSQITNINTFLGK